MVTSSTQYADFDLAEDEMDLAVQLRISGPQRGSRELSGQAKRQRAARFSRKGTAPGLSQSGLHRRRFRKGGAL